MLTLSPNRSINFPTDNTDKLLDAIITTLFSFIYFFSSFKEYMVPFQGFNTQSIWFDERNWCETDVQDPGSFALTIVVYYAEEDHMQFKLKFYLINLYWAWSEKQILKL